jgi:hypothetical protein
METGRILSRRELFQQGALAAGIAMPAGSASKPVLENNKQGNFHFLRGIAPYSSGAIADAGFAVAHVTLSAPPPFRQGFETVDRHLKERGRPPQALCAIELRSPRPFTFDGFNEFNRQYIELLKERNLLLDGLNPVARTNVAPEVRPPAEVLLYGFSYTTPSTAARPTFVVAGAGELTGERLDARDIVRRGDVSPDGLRAKARHVLSLMDERLRGMGAGWQHANAVDVYTVHSISELMRDLLVPHAGAAAIHGIRWHFARPPIEEIEFEMDVRGCLHELMI